MKEPNVTKIFTSSCQIEEFDKVFRDFKNNIKNQMEDFGKKHDCRIIMLDHDLVAIIQLSSMK